ncbi:MAG: ATP-binding cassette domain-containing protein [Verrucomicrobiota bacterium]|nr:ATP-binding cassette domain-containing protein [Limisphaera sp.]MDW8382609.1 ATP-binding cassette domain-containing protein [Verrucomicrobiota bacterium]
MIDYSEASGPILAMIHVDVGCLQDRYRVAVRDVNWQVHSGDFWIVAGSHGSGRTDLLLTAAGLLPPCAGQIQWFGQPQPASEVARQSLRRKVGFVFEQGHLLHDLTVAENVALPCEYHGVQRAGSVEGVVTRMLESTGLRAWADARPAALPVPWQRRALLARALVLQPRLMFFDCPLRGLDRRHAEWWHETLLQLHRGEFPGVSHSVTVVMTAEEPPTWITPGMGVAWIEEGRFSVVTSPANRLAG